MILIKNIEKYKDNDEYTESLVIIQNVGFGKDFFVILSQIPGLVEFMNKQDFKIYIKTDMDILSSEDYIGGTKRQLSFEVYFKDIEHYKSFINDYVVIEKLAK